MRVLRFIGVSVVLLFALITGLSLFFPSHVRVSRAIDITASSKSINGMLADPLQWKKWMPGADSAKLIYDGTVVRGIQLFNGHSLLLTKASPDSIQVTGEKLAAIQASAGWNILGQEALQVRTVQWYMDFYFDWYPWEKFASLLLEPQYGPYMEIGLRQLKEQCEQ